MQEEVSKATISQNGAPLSIAENEASVLRFKIEAAQAHAELLELKDMVPNGMIWNVIILECLLANELNWFLGC